MHTTEKLAIALEEANLPEMAKKARQGYYHDYLSHLPAPCIQLAVDLQQVGTPDALRVRDRHLQGDFDATKEESDEWANSPEGKAAFDSLKRDK